MTQQRGGVKIQLRKYGTIDALNRAFVELNTQGKLPIPSQKRGICMTDSIISSLWYSDYLGEYLWRTLVYNKPVPEVDTRGFEATATGELRREDPALYAREILLLQAYRVVSVMETAEVIGKSSALTRTPTSVPLDIPADIAYGEVCANAMKFFSGADVTLPSFTATPAEHFGYNEGPAIPVIDAVLRQVFGDKVSVFMGRNDPTKSCVAMWVVTREGHAVSCVSVNGIWSLMDNEVGASIPLKGVKFEDIRDGWFSFTYGMDLATNTLTFTARLHSKKRNPRTWTVARKNVYTISVGGSYDHVEQIERRTYVSVDKSITTEHRELVNPEIQIQEAPQIAEQTLATIRGSLAGTEVTAVTPDSDFLTLSKSSTYGVRTILEGNKVFIVKPSGELVFVGTFTTVRPAEMDGDRGRIYSVTFSKIGDVFLDVRGMPGEIRGGIRIIINELQRVENEYQMDVEAVPRPTVLPADVYADDDLKAFYIDFSRRIWYKTGLPIDFDQFHAWEASNRQYLQNQYNAALQQLEERWRQTVEAGAGGADLRSFKRWIDENIQSILNLVSETSAFAPPPAPAPIKYAEAPAVEDPNVKEVVDYYKDRLADYNKPIHGRLRDELLLFEVIETAEPTLLDGFLKLTGMKGDMLNHIKNRSGSPPVYVATWLKPGISESDKLEMIKLLVAAGANVNLPSKNGTTALDVAEADGLSQIKEFLLSKGAVKTRGGFNASRLPSLSKRTVRRFSSSSKRGRTHRQLKSHS